MKELFTCLLFLLLILNYKAEASGWNQDNDPANFDTNYQYHLDSLPLKASLPIEKTPWSSSYWPRNKGSINYRWNAPNPHGFNLISPSRAQLLTMSQQQIAELSPAEKFDLVQGHYDYPLSSSVARGSKPSAKDFEGVCDGWTAAAIEFAEPIAVTVKNPDGIDIPFGSSDVKALMSYDISINAPRGSMESVFVGSYCSVPWGMAVKTPGCKDINPGAFHVILANQIGLKQQSFAADVDPKRETWNQPVYGYEFEIRGRTTAKGAASAYIIHAKMMYAEDDLEVNEPGKIFSWDPTVGTLDFAGTFREYDYILELDHAGRIIGGSWIGQSKKNHPDLFWMPTKKIQFTPEFEILSQLYKTNL